MRRLIVCKANPNHGPDGRFTSDGGGGGGGGSSNERTRDRIEGTQAEADREVAKAGAVVKRIRGKMDAVKARRDALDTPPSIVSQLTAALSTATAKRKALEAQGEQIKGRLAALKAQLAALKKSLGSNFDKLLTDAMEWRMECESLDGYLSELLTTKAPRLIVVKANPNHGPDGRFTSAGGGGGADGERALTGDARKGSADKVFAMYKASYEKIGMQFADSEAMLADTQDYFVHKVAGKDVAFSAYKNTPYGKKLVALGTDGSAEGKAAVRDAFNKLKQPGYYGELSDAPERIATKMEIPTVSASRAAIVLGKSVTILADGVHYERVITGLPGLHTKMLFGRPN